MKIEHIKKHAALFLAIVMSGTVFAGCQKKEAEKEISVRHKEITETEDDRLTPPETLEDEDDDWEEDEDEDEEDDYVEPEKKYINVFTYTDDVNYMVQEYKKLHPDLEYEFMMTNIATDNGGYQQALDACLYYGDEDAPDIFVVGSDFAWDYINGEQSDYAASFDEMGIDMQNKPYDAKIASYTYETGTRLSDGQVVALSYMDSSCFMIYRADIAMEVFGTDDPEEISDIFGGNSGSLDKFFEAAEKLKSKGYAAVSGPDDLWYLVNGCTSSSWLVDGEFNISKERDSFFDISKTIADNDYSNMNNMWNSGWYDDMGGKGDRQVFAFFGPQWFLDYMLTEYSHDTYGNWRITDAPINSYEYQTWIMPSIYASEADPEKKDVIKDFLEWVTLDTSETGYQYLAATGSLDSSGSMMSVPSAVVMEKIDFESDFLGGQNPFEYYISSSQDTHAYPLSKNDDKYGSAFMQAAEQYAEGELDRDQAIEQFLEMASGI